MLLIRGTNQGAHPLSLKTLFLVYYYAAEVEKWVLDDRGKIDSSQVSDFKEWLHSMQKIDFEKLRRASRGTVKPTSDLWHIR
jgi:hypothetical protein